MALKVVLRVTHTPLTKLDFWSLLYHLQTIAALHGGHQTGH